MPMTQAERTNLPLVLALWVAGLFAAAQFGKIALLYDMFQDRFAGGAGIMVSVVGLVGLVFGATAGIVAQQIGLRRILVGGLALGALMSILQSVQLPFWPMMATRVVEGFSHLAVVVAGPVLIARSAAPRHLGAAMSLWSSFFGVSFAITASLGLALVAALGPPSLFLAHAAGMAALSLLIAGMTADDGAPGARRMALGELIARHGRLYSSANVAAPALGFMFYTAMYVALLTLMPTLFDGAERVLVATAMPLVSIVTSLTLGVWMLARRPAVSVVQIGFAVAGGAALALWLGWGTAWASGWTLVLAAGTGLIQGASFASIPQLNDSQDDRSLAAGAVAQLGNLGTTTGTPILAALIAWGGPGGVLAFVLPLAAGGIAMTAWLAWRRGRGR